MLLDWMDSAPATGLTIDVEAARARWRATADYMAQGLLEEITDVFLNGVDDPHDWDESPDDWGDWWDNNFLVEFWRAVDNIVPPHGVEWPS